MYKPCFQHFIKAFAIKIGRHSFCPFRLKIYSENDRSNISYGTILKMMGTYFEIILFGCPSRKHDSHLANHAPK